MSYAGLVSHLSGCNEFPIPVDSILGWIKQSTDFKTIRFHEVARGNKAFQGAFRCRAVPNGRPYSDDWDLVVDILYGADLHPFMKRLVICKELLHVFDPPKAHVNDEDKVKRLIPAVNFPELAIMDLPYIIDTYGVYRALNVLIPQHARDRLASAIESGQRTVAEAANHLELPTPWVDMWLRRGPGIEAIITGVYTP